MTLNMHDIVRGAIQAVVDDVPGTVYVSTGYTSTRGISVPTYTSVTASLQIQALSQQALQHLRNVNYAEGRETIYAYGNFSGIDRPDQTGNGVVQVTGSGQWFAITNVIEWWPGWCQLVVTRQLNAANIAALIAQIQNGANPS